MAWPPEHQSIAEFLDRVRRRYSAAKGEEAARISAWMMDAIDDGKINEAQARAAWGQTQAQWGQTRGRMQADRQALRAVQAARGE